MSKRLKRLSAAALLTAGVTSATPALAEMGLFPTGSDAMFITIFGGYINSDGTATPGHGTIPIPDLTGFQKVVHGLSENPA